MSDKFSEINTLAKAIERLEKMSGELAEAQVKADRVDAVEGALVKLGIDPSAHDTPEALRAEVVRVSNDLGSARAMQVCAAQGVDMPLPVSGQQPGSAADGGDQRTGRERWGKLKL
ncbi:MAG: hypothetical protein JJU00_12760 [Opitutales bacterium]|nr:hypothetical protein [Opitutales bacterium]